MKIGQFLKLAKHSFNFYQMVLGVDLQEVGIDLVMVMAIMAMGTKEEALAMVTKEEALAKRAEDLETTRDHLLVRKILGV